MNKITNFSNLKISQKQDSKVGKSSLSSLSLSAKKILKTCFLASIVFLVFLFNFISCKQIKEEEKEHQYHIGVNLNLEKTNIPPFSRNAYNEDKWDWWGLNNDNSNANISGDRIEFPCPDWHIGRSGLNEPDEYNLVTTAQVPKSDYIIGISLLQDDDNLLDKFHYACFAYQEIGSDGNGYSMMPCVYLFDKLRKDPQYFGNKEDLENFNYKISLDVPDCLSVDYFDILEAYVSNISGHKYDGSFFLFDLKETNYINYLYLALEAGDVGEGKITFKLEDNEDNVLDTKSIDVRVNNDYVNSIYSNFGPSNDEEEQFYYMVRNRFPVGASFSVEKFNLEFYPKGVKILNENLQYISSDPEVLSIDDGIITALSPGNASITPIYENIFGQILHYEEVGIDVVQPYLLDIQLPEQIKLNGLEKKQLEVGFYPDCISDKSVVFSSSNPDVVEVDENGKLKSKSIGTVTITVTSPSAGYKGCSVQATCECTVNELLVTSIDFGDEEVQMYLGDDLELNVSLIPSNTTQEFEYIFDDSTHFKILDNGKIRAIKTGETTITAKIKGSSVKREKHINIVNSALTFNTASHTGFCLYTEDYDTKQPVSNWDGVLEYMANPEDGWTEWHGEKIQSSIANKGSCLYLRGFDNTIISGKGPIGNNQYRGRFRFGAHDDNQYNSIPKICCIGDIRTLLDYRDVENTTMGDNCFYGLFCYAFALTEAPSLPAKSLSPHCYERMFGGCSNLTAPPTLPAETLSDYCYSHMFIDAFNLIVPIDYLPATILAPHCYDHMFATSYPSEYSITTVPALPATTLADDCYNGMFERCISITSIPALPSDVSNVGPYSFLNMFNDCIGLKFVSERSDECPNKIVLPTNNGNNKKFTNLFYGTQGDYGEVDPYERGFESGQEIWTNAEIVYSDTNSQDE